MPRKRSKVDRISLLVLLMAVINTPWPGSSPYSTYLNRPSDGVDLSMQHNPSVLIHFVLSSALPILIRMALSEISSQKTRPRRYYDRSPVLEQSGRLSPRLFTMGSENFLPRWDTWRQKEPQSNEDLNVMTSEVSVKFELRLRRPQH